MDDDSVVLLNWVNYKLQTLGLDEIDSIDLLFATPDTLCLLLEQALNVKVDRQFDAIVAQIERSGLQLEREPSVFLNALKEHHTTNNVVLLWHIVELLELMPLGLTCGGLSHTSQDLKAQLETLVGKRIKRFSSSKLNQILTDVLASFDVKTPKGAPLDVAARIIGYDLFKNVDMESPIEEKSFILLLSVILANRDKFSCTQIGRPLPQPPSEPTGYDDDGSDEMEESDDGLPEPVPALLPKLRKRYGNVFCRNIAATKYQLIIQDSLSQTIALLCLLFGICVSFVFLFLGRAIDLSILYAVFAITLLLNSCWAFLAHAYITNFDRRSNTVTVIHSKWFCRAQRKVMDLDALTGAIVDNGAVFLQFGDLDFVPITRRGRWHAAFKAKMVDRVDLFLKRIRGQLPKPGVSPTFLVALYDFEPDSGSGDIPLQAGELIRVDTKDDQGWWTGRVLRDGEAISGTFPVNYTKVMHPSEEYLLSKNVK